MQLYLDTEFTGLNQSAEFISIALVSADERTFYAEFIDYDPTKLSNWHHENVLPQLVLQASNANDSNRNQHWEVLGNREAIAADLRTWLTQFETIEIWADCLAYDWVLFCELFGGSLHLPANVFYIPFDLATLLKIRGIDPDISRLQFLNDQNISIRGLSQHNALADAKILKKCYELLT